MNKLIPAALLMALAGTVHAQMPTPEEVMKELDKNNDGAISKEEAAGSPLEGFYDNVDANKDGKVTVEELKAMMGG